MGWLDDVGDAVEHAVDTVTEKVGELADKGAEAAASVARSVGADGVAKDIEDLGDQIVDATGGQVRERELGQSDDPKELILGDTGKISHAEDELKKMGDSIEKTGDALKKIDVADWVGATADAFHGEFGKQPKLWWQGSDAMHAAAGVLDAWYHEVAAAQSKAADAIAKWKQADTEENNKKNSWNRLSDAQKRKNPLVDTWTSMRQAARDILRGARSQRDNAAATAVSGLEAATSSAPTEPSFTARMKDDFSDASAAVDQAKLNFTKGLTTSFTGIVQFVRQVSPLDTYNMTHPADYFKGMSDLGTALVVADADPGATVHSFLSDARKNPSEFLGSLTGNLVTTIGTGGAGAAKPALSAVKEVSEVSDAAKAARVAEDVAKDAPHSIPKAEVPHPAEAPQAPSPHEPAPTSTGSDAAHPGDAHAKYEPQTPADRAEADHGTHHEASDSGPEHDRTEHQKTCSDDPVDIATGEFLLPETDIDLPGVLALVLRRTHRSNYRRGRWFGPSWSATLDMRLVAEHEGVTFLAEDGLMLAYPHAEVGVAVEPVTGGQQWTLTRTETGSYQVWDPRRELIWHFAPEAVLGGIESRLGNYAISAITDRYRNRIRFGYNDDGVPVEVTHSGGYRVLIETAAGRVTGLSVIDRGAVVPVKQFGYHAGELTSVTNGVGAVMGYAYDDEHRMVSWTDSNGNQMVNTYDHAGRVIFQRGTEGVLDTDFDYFEFPDGTGSLTTVTDSYGAATRHGFDRDLRQRDLIDPVGGHTHIDYNADRRPLQVTAPDGAVTRYEYTATGDVAKVVRPDGNSTSVEYLFRDRPTTITNPDGGVRRQEWNKHGDLVATIDAAGTRTEYTYHPNGAVAEVTESTGARTITEVDAAGLAIQGIDPQGAVTRIERDGFGRPVTVTDSLGATTCYEWSPAGALLRRVDPDGYSEVWGYDGEGNLLIHTDRAGGVTRYEYGAFDLLASRIDPDGTVTRYRWDSQRRLVAVTNPLGQVWTYEYDPSGRVVTETDYAGAATRYTYDRAGRTATVTPATGITRHHTYDVLGHLTEITTDTGEFIRNRLDTVGRTLTAVSGTDEGPTHTLEFNYTLTGQIATQQVDDQPVMRLDYDLHGRRIRRTTPSGAATRWRYDVAGRVHGLDVDGGPVHFRYDPAGRPIGWSIGEIVVDRALTSVGQVAQQTVTAHPTSSLNLPLGPSTRPGPTQLRHDTFVFRPDGYVTGHITARPGVDSDHREYLLDPMGRVTAITRGDSLLEEYGYDPLSNITAALAEPAPPTSHDVKSLAAQHFPHSDRREYRNNLLVRDGRTRYYYDAAGRLIRKETARLSHKPDVWHFRYNAFDQLIDAWTPDRQWWHYTYDALGRRCTKQHLSGDGTVLERVDYTWDGTHLIEQTTAQAITRWQYQPDSHTPITQTTNRQDGGRESVAIIADLVGTPIELIDHALAESVGIAETTLWGRMKWHGTADTPFRFPGQLYDPETGVNYNLHRIYDPATGRYHTSDPLGLSAAPNPVGYPHNPIVWCDPLGLLPQGCTSSSGPPPQTVTEHEYYDPKPVKPGNVLDRWSDFLGPGEHTNLHPRTGVPDPGRIVSEDGLRSIRFGAHEMGSSPTKFHYHEETWKFISPSNTWHVDNRVVRVPFPKGTW
ncbi:RHS repeat-associated protein [Nocardia sp. GAS34]|uniref:putative T7SS-secreted protein n=1 Tax=unclassified Nocardia TaxID=2637762 RepID=UPI003D1A7A22